MFDPIAPGDRGSAVEDVQKRLLMLGFDLGPTGIDGVFLGATFAAVRSFQADHHLAEDGVIGDETWSALVDATFTLGDRLLYLRFPHLHGADVRRLQGALNVLGFACGEPDGIFGAFTERAVREFQANVGLPADGIAGMDTVRMLERLGHVWEGKDPTSPAALTVAPVRAAEVLRRTPLVLVGTDACGRAVAGRLENLVRASEPEAIIGDDAGPAAVTLTLTCDPTLSHARTPVIVIADAGSPGGRFISAFEARGERREAVVVVPPEVADSEHGAQACAVAILDGLCAALSGGVSAVLP